MADRGRKKKPPALTVLDGGRDLLKAVAPMPESPPAWLLEDMAASGSPMPTAAVRFWETYAPKLNDAGISTELHLPKFAMLCCSWAAWLRDPGDYKIINPTRGLGAEFCMDPASSAKLRLTDDGDSPLGKILKARGM